MDDDDRSYFATEWRTAQAITLTIPNLVTAAKQELSFLARVNQDPGLTHAGPALDCAVRRYEVCWLPLLASQEKGATALVPPLDCAWVWHCHRLNPVRYAHDCKAVFGKILGAPVPQARSMVAATETTIQLWKKRYSTMPYQHHGVTTASFGKVGIAASRRRVSYNLVDAVLRQSSFYYQVSQLHVRQEAFLHAAEMRYKGFLHLAAKSKGKLFLVPTYDIDLMWHAHQLDPIAYRIDTLQILGKVLDHDDTGTERHEGSKLSNCFLETKQLWEETYSLPFEKAGAMWRGEAPTSLQFSSSTSSLELLKNGRFTSYAYKAEQEAQYGYLTGRETVQMRINILGAKNVPAPKRSGPRIFVRMRAMRKCGSFETNTPEVEISEQPRWKQGPWTLSFETSVEGVVLELRMRKSCLLGGGLKKKSTLLGEAHIPFNMLMASPTLSALDWLSLHKDDQIWDLQKKPPALEIAASITPPVSAPYLFRAVNAKTTDDNFQEVSERWRHSQMGRWLTRTVLDHRGKAIYTVRIRKLKGCRKANGLGVKDLVPVAENERIISVYRPNGVAKSGDPNVALAASAIQLMDTKDQLENAHLQRQWALFEPNTIFTVKKNRDPQMDEYPELTVEGTVGCPIGLVSGRWLQYQVKDSQPEEERGFVTVIRYTPECPTGKATALFNWKSAAMEVTPGENAVFVLLLCSVTTLAIHDLLGTMSKRPTKVTKKTTLPNKAEWGAVNIETGTKPNGPSSTNRFWWTMSSQVWAHEMYDSTSSKSTAAECGGAGACGGGACASGRTAGGGAGSGGSSSLSSPGGASFSGSYTYSGSFTSTF
ncbi:hypothetical protein M758_4G236500 [Ceratodon purpureus]|nr:hypothetical protein M758_4G236500 [Ceratodon purpureus]KAG0620700.1 hypothetical protein M758_4G236500 [Ceratodon purpureus]KAG0620701.1 hypothetical protein M758_4G236500 [Ceratodon purpureus]